MRQQTLNLSLAGKSHLALKIAGNTSVALLQIELGDFEQVTCLFLSKHLSLSPGPFVYLDCKLLKARTVLELGLLEGATVCQLVPFIIILLLIRTEDNHVSPKYLSMVMLSNM